MDDHLESTRSDLYPALGQDPSLLECQREPFAGGAVDEYDYMATKQLSDWERFFEVIAIISLGQAGISEPGLY